ncbi:sensor histidine kinase, partial [Frankia sp. CNm7]
ASAVPPAALAVLAVAGTLLADPHTRPSRGIDAGGLVLVVAASLALVARRRWPVVTLAVVTSLVTAYLWLGYTYGPVLFPFVFAMYAVARHLPARVALPAGTVALAVLLSHIFVSEAALPGLAGLLPGSAWAAVPFAVGFAARTRADAERRAREQHVRHHVDAERLRLSREVHDVVGHGLAAINMQANVALRSVTRNPARVEEALKAISSSSGAALDELRAVLTRLGETDDPAPRQPRTGLRDIPALARRLEQTGMRVVVDGDGPEHVPPAVDLAAYRIAQEALTNALRHGRGDLAGVSIRHTATELSLTVTNPTGGDRAAAAATGSGLGVPGMRERAEAVGGRLVVSPGPSRYEVHAVLPLEAP